METKTHSESSSGSNVFLTGVVLLANLDFNGLLDYAFKAIIGGAIWYGYKMTAEHFDRKRNLKK